MTAVVSHLHQWAAWIWGRGTTVVASIDAIEPQILLGLTAAFLIVGNKISADWKTLRSVTAAFAGGLFAVLAGQLLLRDRPNSRGVEPIVRSLLVAGLFLGAAWTVGPLLGIVYEATLGVLFRGLWRLLRGGTRVALWIGAVPFRIGRACCRKVIGMRRGLVDRQDRKRREKDALVADAARRRRSEAKFRCECRYAQLAPELRERFSRAQFDDFMSRFLSEDQPPDVVDKNAQQLEELLKRHHEKIEPSHSIDRLAAWYEGNRDAIAKLPVAESFKKTQLANLNTRFAEMLGHHLRENLP